MQTQHPEEEHAGASLPPCAYKTLSLCKCRKGPLRKNEPTNPQGLFCTTCLDIEDGAEEPIDCALHPLKSASKRLHPGICITTLPTSRTEWSMLYEAHPALTADESLEANSFLFRVFSAIALTAFRYALEGGEGHTIAGAREHEGTHAHIQ